VPIIPSGYANILIPYKHSGSARSAAVTFGVKNEGAFATPNAVANAVWNAWDPEVTVAVDSDVTVGPVQASVNYGGDPVTGFGDDSSIGGTGLSSIPGNGALLVQKLSILGGRKNRGRFYLPWSLQEANVDELGGVAGGTVTDYQAIFDNVLAALTTEDVPMVILHSVAGTPATVSQLVVQSTIGTQRRRIRG
jgi:hypothetical protein